MSAKWIWHYRDFEMYLTKKDAAWQRGTRTDCAGVLGGIQCALPGSLS